MAVLSGTATIRFGVADTSDDLAKNTHGHAWEEGGVMVQACAGDVFVIPAGVAHKTFNAQPEKEFALLTPGKGHGIEVSGGKEEDVRRALGRTELSGFTMMGAYSGGEWDFVMRGGEYERVWGVPKPLLDPVFGDAEEGLVGTWKGSGKGAEARL
ncbi:hypothetical protein BJX64DRAFT_281775 [Aspergillus heterothallicus]